MIMARDYLRYLSGIFNILCHMHSNYGFVITITDKEKIDKWELGYSLEYNLDET